MRLTEINIMNMNQTNMNNLRMTYMNQLNNPLLLNLTMMPNSSMNLTHFKNNDDKEEKYIGQIVNGFRHGKGNLYYKNGSLKYQGDFLYDNFEGNGKMVYENGFYYIGQFKKGIFNGKGKLFYENGNIYYEGDFIDDYFHGNGKMNIILVNFIKIFSKAKEYYTIKMEKLNMKVIFFMM